MQVGQEAVVYWLAFLIITLAHVWASQLVPGVKTQLANAGDGRDEGLVPGSGRAPEEGCGNTLQYSFWENSMDGGARRATVHRVTESDTTEVT